MNIIWWILFGLVAGVVAKWIMPGKEKMGFIVTTLLGIVGAVVGGFIGQLLGWGSVTNDFDLGNLALAVVGALLVLFVFNKIRN